MHGKFFTRNLLDRDPVCLHRVPCIICSMCVICRVKLFCADSDHHIFSHVIITFRLISSVVEDMLGVLVQSSSADLLLPLVSTVLAPRTLLFFFYSMSLHFFLIYRLEYVIFYFTRHDVTNITLLIRFACRFASLII